MPELRKNFAARAMDLFDHPLPAGQRLFAVKVRHIRVGTSARMRNVRSLRDDQPHSALSAAPVIGGDFGSGNAARRLRTRHRSHRDAVRKGKVLDGQGLKQNSSTIVDKRCHEGLIEWMALEPLWSQLPRSPAPIQSTMGFLFAIAPHRICAAAENASDPFGCCISGERARSCRLVSPRRQERRLFRELAVCDKLTAMHLMRTLCRVLGISVVLFVITAVLTAATGEEVYKSRCSGCHDQANPRIPPRDSLMKMPASRILKVLDFGVMMQVAYHLSREDREAVAKYLGTEGAETSLPAEAFCKDRKVSINDKSKFIWDGWSPKGDNTRFQTADIAGLSLDDVKKLKLKWAFGYEGDVNAFAFPAFFDGQMFVGSARGTIYALRAESGCVQWTFDAHGPVRSAMIDVPNGARHALLFGDQIGSYYALEAETGKLIWSKRIEDHDTARLTGAGMVHDGIVYVPVASWEETRSSGPEDRKS